MELAAIGLKITKRSASTRMLLDLRAKESSTVYTFIRWSDVLIPAVIRVASLYLSEKEFSGLKVD